MHAVGRERQLGSARQTGKVKVLVGHWVDACSERRRQRVGVERVIGRGYASRRKETAKSGSWLGSERYSPKVRYAMERRSCTQGWEEERVGREADDESPDGDLHSRDNTAV